MSGFRGDDKKEWPRYPAMVLETSTRTPVAEAALDFDPARDPNKGTEREVWCLLLHVQESCETRRYTFLVLVQVTSTGNSELKYMRIGLGWAAETPETLLFTGRYRDEVTIV